MVNKTLVFHIYIYKGEDYFNNIAYKFHMECLKHYSKVFNKACFNISCEDITDEYSINRVKHDIIDCGFSNIEIIVSPNDGFCESSTFKHFILERMDKMDGLVFFGHTKGLINVIDGINYPENILHWVYTMYYFNLNKEYVENMERMLIYSYGGKQCSFYGTLRTFVDNESCSFYPGTFYWINVGKLYEDNRRGKISIPKIYNRNFCEELPFVYKDNENNFNGLASCCNRYILNIWLYNDNDWDNISNYLSGGNNGDYLDLYNKIRNSI